MGDTRVTIGAKGRLVLPAAIRERKGWDVGTELVAIEGPTGVALVDRDSLKAALRAQLAGGDVVAELLAERRKDAERDAG
ncbi:MAG: transcriptional regulator, AbrB family [Naasia sp.]|nr:transcriptional regulator, AbrB family [Naasia sp.]